MRLGEVLRRAAFFGLDAARGGPVRRHIRDIGELLWDPARRDAVNAARLERLLHHAGTTTEFYRGYQSAHHLPALPVVTKEDIKQNYQQVLSSAFRRSQLSSFSTSGSYGVPMTFYLSPDKMRRRQAEVIYFGRWAGFALGQKYALIQAVPHGGRFTRLAKNEYPIVPVGMDRSWLERHRRVLLSSRIEVAIGYPSPLVLLAHYCQEQGDQREAFPLRSAIYSGERLSDDDRALIEDTFGCRVFSRYACVEFGVLAQECPQGRQHLNVASYLIETLDPKGDRAVPSGAVGRIVVTDLSSFAMPLIRYDTGDLGAVDPAPCLCACPAPVLARLDGRLVEQIYDVDGHPVASLAIAASLRGLLAIKRYQFIQRGEREYEVLLCLQTAFGDQAVLLGRLRERLGHAARIELRYVDDIPSLPSGKRPYIMNAMMARGRAPEGGNQAERCARS